jgi:hypothetical protein
MASHRNVLIQLQHGLSEERLGPYLDACHGRLGDALALYQWNARIAAAFWVDLAHAEVFIRNALDKQLASRIPAGQPWYNALGGILSPEALGAIAKAKGRVQAEGKPLSPGRVLAAISFGFWRFLLSGRYDRTLWRPCLHRAFPACHAPRRVVHSTMYQLHHLRNRIAHHEPIHGRDLKSDYEDLLLMVGWIDPIARQWVETASTVLEGLSRRPASG